MYPQPTPLKVSSALKTSGRLLRFLLNFDDSPAFQQPVKQNKMIFAFSKVHTQTLIEFSWNAFKQKKKLIFTIPIIFQSTKSFEVLLIIFIKKVHQRIPQVHRKLRVQEKKTRMAKIISFFKFETLFQPK